VAHSGARSMSPTPRMDAFCECQWLHQDCRCTGPAFEG